MKKFLTILFILAAVVVPMVSSAQSVPDGISACSIMAGTGVAGVVRCLVGVMNTAIGLIISASVLYVIWGAFNMIRSEEKREEGKKVILHGIIGIFVMISVWGLVNILNNTFGLNQDAITPPNLIEVKL